MKDVFDVTPLKKKKKVNSRAKGNRFENKVAKMLNERFETDEFCRSPGSGAFATTHKLPKHLQLYGDLITPEKFRFVIECKKGYNSEGISELLNPKSNTLSMIAQASRDSRKANKKFLLIVGQDRKDPIVFTEDKPTQISSSAGLLFEGYVEETKVYILRLENLLKSPTSHFFH
jgi:hypothetical protein